MTTQEDEAVEVTPEDAAAVTPTPTPTPTTDPPRKLGSAQSTGMEASVLRVKNVNFTVGKGDKTKQILRDINVKIKWGHVLACE